MKTYFLNQCRSCGRSQIGDHESMFCSECLASADKTPWWIKAVSIITLIFILAVALSSCSEEEIKPCDDAYGKMYVAEQRYENLLKDQHRMMTLADAVRLQDKIQVAFVEWTHAKAEYEECSK